MAKYMKDFNGEEVFCLEYDKATLVDMVCELQQRIDKAIKYIENNNLYEQDYDYDYEENLVEYSPTDEQARKDLLEILKGEDKE